VVADGLRTAQNRAAGRRRRGWAGHDGPDCIDGGSRMFFGLLAPMVGEMKVRRV